MVDRIGGAIGMLSGLLTRATAGARADVPGGTQVVRSPYGAAGPQASSPYGGASSAASPYQGGLQAASPYAGGTQAASPYAGAFGAATPYAGQGGPQAANIRQTKLLPSLFYTPGEHARNNPQEARATAEAA